MLPLNFVSSYLVLFYNAWRPILLKNCLLLLVSDFSFILVTDWFSYLLITSMFGCVLCSLRNCWSRLDLLKRLSLSVSSRLRFLKSKSLRFEFLLTAMLGYWVKLVNFRFRWNGSRYGENDPSLLLSFVPLKLKMGDSVGSGLGEIWMFM